VIIIVLHVRYKFPSKEQIESWIFAQLFNLVELFIGDVTVQYFINLAVADAILKKKCRICKIKCFKTCFFFLSKFALHSPNFALHVVVIDTINALMNQKTD